MKPRVILNAAMTLDGKIATKSGNSEISGKEDLSRVHRLRQECDAIMVGINTVLVDDPRLTVHKISANPDDNPVRVVVDSQARTPPSSRVLSEDAPTIIAVSKKATSDRLEKLSQHATIMVCGEEWVDLESLMENLGHKGIGTIMLEGGSTLNFSMISLGLVNEVRVCLAPMIVGGSQAKTLVDGEGMEYMSQAVKLKLIRSYPLGEDLILEYEVRS
ncbi:MAG: 2,5-diamino-6-(ribosylamino)-4(3H)-pyrimidinone 5'-phosphate reductase [Methanobacteriaceae archaeon]